MANTKYKYARAFMNMEINQSVDETLVMDADQMESDTRILIQRLKRIVESPSWSNAGNWNCVTPKTTDKLVMYSFLYIAFLRNSLEFRTSCREIAVIAGVGHMTAARSIKRLIANGMIGKVRNHPDFYKDGSRENKARIARMSRKYKVILHERMIDTSQLFQPNSQGDKLIHINNDNICISLSRPDMTEPGTEFYLQTRDVWWNGVDWKNVEMRKDASGKYRRMPRLRLGKTAAALFVNLQNRQMATAEELASIVGCHSRTVSRNLEKMAGFGMVSQNDLGQWMANHDTDFYEIEQSLDLLGKGKKHFREYLQQSDEHHKLMDLWANDYDKYAELRKEKREQRKARNTVTVTDEHGRLVTRKINRKTKKG